MKVKRTIASVFLSFVLLATVNIGAQERGQYLPGLRGLNTAEQPGTGFTYANYFFWYPTDSFRNNRGDEAPIDFDLDLVADVNLLAYTPKKKFLGATYSASVAIPILNAAVTIPRFNGNIDGPGIGDIYVEPISLQWAMKKGKIRTAYGFTAPSGADSVTSDFWGHALSFGGTYNPGKTGLWQINGHSTWELHHKKRNEDIKVGNNVTFEYGVGKTFVKNQGKQLLQFGVVGYSEFQLTNDSGSDVLPINAVGKDRVHAIGPEFGVILPAKKFNFLVRVLPEYGARSRTKGVTVVFAVGKTF